VKSHPKPYNKTIYGRLDSLVCDQEVADSIPVVSTVTSSADGWIYGLPA
jgi:hypothetical protein